jgi:hypothetical protein
VAFDIAQHLIDHITHLEDQLKQVKRERSSAVVGFDDKIAALTDELDAFQALLANADTKRPAATKAAAKK